MGKAMESAQVLARIRSSQGGLKGLVEAQTMLEAVGGIVYSFQQMLAKGGLSMLDNKQNWEDMQVLADTFDSWLSPLSDLANALVEVNKLRELDNIGAIMQHATTAMTMIAEQSWTLIKDVINAPGLAEFQSRSQSVAGTFDAWIGVFSAMGEFTMALRKTRVEQLDRTDVLRKMVEVMETMGGLLWGNSDEPGIVQLVSRGADATAGQDLSQSVAGTVGVWTSIFADVAKLSREIPVFKDSSAILPAIESFSKLVVDLGDSVTEALKKLHPGDPGGAAELMGNVADIVSGWAGSLKDMAGTSREIVTYVQPTVGEWTQIKIGMTDLWNNFKDFANRVGDLVEWSLETEPRMKAWAEAVGKDQRC
jgi:hypothetical protein